jgi:hypothetical protein
MTIAPVATVGRFYRAVTHETIFVAVRIMTVDTLTRISILLMVLVNDELNVLSKFDAEV